MIRWASNIAANLRMLYLSLSVCTCKIKSPKVLNAFPALVKISLTWKRSIRRLCYCWIWNYKLSTNLNGLGSIMSHRFPGWVPSFCLSKSEIKWAAGLRWLRPTGLVGWRRKANFEYLDAFHGDKVKQELQFCCLVKTLELKSWQTDRSAEAFVENLVDWTAFWSYHFYGRKY